MMSGYQSGLEFYSELGYLDWGFPH